MAIETMQPLHIALEDIYSQYSQWSGQLQETPVAITDHDVVVGIMLSPDMYNRLCRIQAYFDIVALSRSFRENDVTAQELYRISREELEARN